MPTSVISCWVRHTQFAWPLTQQKSGHFRLEKILTRFVKNHKWHDRNLKKLLRNWAADGSIVNFSAIQGPRNHPVPSVGISFFSRFVHKRYVKKYLRFGSVIPRKHLEPSLLGPNYSEPDTRQNPSRKFFRSKMRSSYGMRKLPTITKLTWNIFPMP